MKKILTFLLLSGLSFAQTAGTRMLAGVNYQSGASYTFKASDQAKLTVFTAPSTVTLPGSSTPLFGINALFSVHNASAGLVTINCTGCTINNQAKFDLSAQSGADIYGDGTNYTAFVGTGSQGTIFASTGLPIASAITLACTIGGGTVSTYPGYRETITSHVDLGTISCPITLKLAANTILTCNVTDGTYCFGIHNASGIIGTIVGTQGSGRTGGAVILGAATMNVSAMVKSMEPNQAYFTIKDLWIENSTLATVGGCNVSSCPSYTGAVLWIDGVGNISAISNIDVIGYSALACRLSSNTGFTGPLNFDNVWCESVNKVNGQPLQVLYGGGTIANIRFVGGGYTDPGPGLPAVEINGNGSVAALRGIDYNSYTEVGSSSNIGIKIVDALDVFIHGTSITPTSGATNQTGIDISETGVGRTKGITIDTNQITGSGSGFAINNHITGETLANNGTDWPGYRFTSESFQNSWEIIGNNAITFRSTTNAGIHTWTFTGDTAFVPFQASNVVSNAYSSSTTRNMFTGTNTNAANSSWNFLDFCSSATTNANDCTGGAQHQVTIAGDGSAIFGGSVSTPAFICTSPGACGYNLGQGFLKQPQASSIQVVAPASVTPAGWSLILPGASAGGNVSSKQGTGAVGTITSTAGGALGGGVVNITVPGSYGSDPACSVPVSPGGGQNASCKVTGVLTNAGVTLAQLSFPIPGTLYGNAVSFPITFYDQTELTVGASGLVATTADFTTAVSTALQAIAPGSGPALTFTIPGTNTYVVGVHCRGMYSQATAAVPINFGFQVQTVAPTNVQADGLVYTSKSVSVADGLRLSVVTTAVPIFTSTVTPSAFGAIGTIADMFRWEVDFTIENPAATLNIVNMMVSTSVGADAVTIYRGASCTRWNQ